MTPERLTAIESLVPHFKATEFPACVNEDAIRDLLADRDALDGKLTDVNDELDSMNKFVAKLTAELAALKAPVALDRYTLQHGRDFDSRLFPDLGGRWVKHDQAAALVNGLKAENARLKLEIDGLLGMMRAKTEAPHA